MNNNTPEKPSAAAGYLGSCIIQGNSCNNSPITIYMSENSALAAISAERDALAAEVAWLRQLVQQLLTPPTK